MSMALMAPRPSALSAFSSSYDTRIMGWEPQSQYGTAADLRPRIQSDRISLPSIRDVIPGCFDHDNPRPLVPRHRPPPLPAVELPPSPEPPRYTHAAMDRKRRRLSDMDDSEPERLSQVPRTYEITSPGHTLAQFSSPTRSMAESTWASSTATSPFSTGIASPYSPVHIAPALAPTPASAAASLHEKSIMLPALASPSERDYSPPRRLSHGYSAVTPHASRTPSFSAGGVEPSRYVAPPPPPPTSYHHQQQQQQQHSYHPGGHHSGHIQGGSHQVHQTFQGHQVHPGQINHGLQGHHQGDHSRDRPVDLTGDLPSDHHHHHYHHHHHHSQEYGLYSESPVTPISMNGPGGNIMVGMMVESRQRKRRGNLPKDTTDKLRSWFHTHSNHPYPTEEEKQELMRQTGLQMTQISNWFINYRRRGGGRDVKRNRCILKKELSEEDSKLCGAEDEMNKVRSIPGSLLASDGDEEADGSSLMDRRTILMRRGSM